MEEARNFSFRMTDGGGGSQHQHKKLNAEAGLNFFSISLEINYMNNNTK